MGFGRVTRLSGPDNTALALSGASTGLIDGGVITINSGDASKVDISAGEGRIINASDPTNITETYVRWDAFTAVTLTDIANQDITFLCINNTGAVVQSAEFPTNGDLRDCIDLGSAFHPNRTTITSTSDFTAARPFQNTVTLTELSQALGVINERGNIFSGDPAGNLKIKKTAGRQFYAGIQRDPDDPNHISTIEQTAPNFLPLWKSGSDYITGAATDTVIAGVWDDQSVSPSQPGGTLSTNSWANHLIIFSPDTGVNGTIGIAYGQTVYNQKDDAILGIQTEEWDVNPQFNGVPRMFVLTMRGGATNLTDPVDASFERAGLYVIGAPTV